MNGPSMPVGTTVRLCLLLRRRPELSRIPFLSVVLLRSVLDNA